MKDKDKTKEQLIEELIELRQRFAELKKSDVNQKQAGKRIWESENKDRTLFENATDAIYIIDPETQKIFDCNPKASEIIGYTIKELKAMKIEDLHPAKEQAIVSRIFKKIAERGSLSGISGINQQRKDGKLIPIEINATTIKLGDKKYSLGIIRDITDRKKAEDAVRESEERYQKLSASAFEGIVIHDKGKILDANQTFAKMFGYKTPEIIGMNGMKLITPKSRDIVSEKINSGYEKSYEATGLKKDGSTFQMEIRGKSILYRGKRLRVAVVCDITERKKAEEALKKSEKQFRDLVDNSLVGIYKTNLKGEILYVNDALCRIAGYDSPEEIMSENVINKYKNKSDREVLIKILKEKRNVKNFELELIKKNGDTINVLLSAFLQGDIISGMIMDITERKQAEENLVHAKKEWEKTFDTIPDIIAVIDNQYRIIKANKTMAKKLGVTRKKLIGKLCYNVIHGTEEPPSNCPHGKCVSDGKEHIEEFYADNLKGHYILSATPLSDSEGHVIGVVEVARDITERKKIENKLQAVAITDDLTGLFNRRGFFTSAEQQCKLADRTKRGLFLLYLDLDSLKAINDRHGHKVGDQALVDTANILKKSFRKSDIIARIGGDEFAVLLTEPSKPDIENIIINHVKDNLKIFNEQASKNYKLSLSMGITYYDPEHPCSLDNLISRADALMYDYKKHYKLDEKATPSLHEDMRERRAYKRFKTGNNYRAKLDDTDKFKIKNISIGGICLKTSHHLNTSSIYKIKIFSYKNKEISTEGIVVWSYLIGTTTEKESSFPYYETGLKFIEMTYKLRSSLEKFITNLTI